MSRDDFYYTLFNFTTPRNQLLEQADGAPITTRSTNASESRDSGKGGRSEKLRKRTRLRMNVHDQNPNYQF